MNIKQFSNFVSNYKNEETSGEQYLKKGLC